MKRIYSLLLFLVLAFPALAQDSHTGNSDRKWFYPDHMVIQFAGNIGMVSAGFGYSYLKDKVRTDLLYGFVPGFENTTSIHIVTIKNSYHPWSIPLNNGFELQPLRTGFGISYSAGRQFHTSWPDKYPESYYWWASSVRFTPFIGASVSRQVGTETTLIKRLELYTELGSTDLDLISKWSNKSLPVWDILNLAVGTKLVF